MASSTASRASCVVAHLPQSIHRQQAPQQARSSLFLPLSTSLQLRQLLSTRRHRQSTKPRSRRRGAVTVAAKKELDEFDRKLKEVRDLKASKRRELQELKREALSKEALGGGLEDDLPELESDFMKGIVKAGEWLIFQTENESGIFKIASERALLIILPFWAVAVAIAAGYIQTPFYDAPTSTFHWPS